MTTSSGMSGFHHSQSELEGLKIPRDCSRLGNSFSLYPFATEDTGQMLVVFFLSSVKEVMAYSSLLVTTECC